MRGTAKLISQGVAGVGREATTEVSRTSSVVTERKRTPAPGPGPLITVRRGTGHGTRNRWVATEYALTPWAHAMVLVPRGFTSKPSYWSVHCVLWGCSGHGCP